MRTQKEQLLRLPTSRHLEELRQALLASKESKTSSGSSNETAFDHHGRPVKASLPAELPRDYTRSTVNIIRSGTLPWHKWAAPT
jgi:hypothetical protein